MTIMMNLVRRVKVKIGQDWILIKDWYEANEEQNDKSNNQGNVSKRI